ncbi:MAG TPA: hypothetical protein VGA89_03705 [Patescibacteria group bacterium]|jgi:hypothetical protein
MVKILEKLVRSLPSEIVDLENKHLDPEELLIKAIIALALALEGNSAPLNNLFDELPEKGAILTTPAPDKSTLLTSIRSELDKGNLVVQKKAGQYRVIDRSPTNQSKLDLNRLIAHSSPAIIKARKPEKITSIHLASRDLINPKIFQFMAKQFPNLKMISVDASLNLISLPDELSELIKKRRIKINIHQKRTSNQV